MQLALATPLFRSIVVGGLLFGLTVAEIRSTHHHRSHHRLVLRTTRLPHAIYLTAWRGGSVHASFEDGAQLQPIVFKTTALIGDGCEWLGIETLTPISADRFAYDYREEILQCEPDSIPAIKTPRVGIVTVE